MTANSLTPPPSPPSESANVPPKYPSSRVRLNVGGRIFETSRKTLTTHSLSFLAIMFDPSNASMLHPDPDGSVFIDRSPELFVPILEFYRTGRLEVPPGMSKKALMAEVEFYGLSEAVDEAGGIEKVKSDNHSNGSVKSVTFEKDTGMDSENLQQLVSVNEYSSSLLRFMAYGNSKDLLIKSLGQRSTSVLRKALTRNIFPFSMHVSTDGRHHNVPDALMQEAADREFWQDFAEAVSILKAASFIKEFTEQMLAATESSWEEGGSEVLRRQHKPLQTLRIFCEREFVEERRIRALQYFELRESRVKFLAGWRVEWTCFRE
ncbi:hypothetical protein HDV00_004778 [Rhizophlyctis rosea]|nr:hypothetical protein HDV00_004778 [Rhizophlyctis rosea]